ncbi:MAG: 1-acyl-sn-glycerol-3-phosphate acyltransferase [Thermoguttaceae bacterium]|nr:1-acyl-sn-glycerol-3-phosphate acyltransferase [Thermoguttaceae bacterium]MDW8036616.1 lysophospholipid acyltransferase family protein [Thermoguttaceae bacterium]
MKRGVGEKASVIRERRGILARGRWGYRLLYAIARRVCQVFAVGLYQVRYTGRENIPPEGGVLVVANHQSHFDPPLVGMGCMRELNYLARDSLFRVRPLRWIMELFDTIPIKRDGMGLEGIKETLRRLKQGEMVLMFPEGTRCWDGQVGPFRPGFTTLALRSGASILPVGIEGAYQVWPRWRRFPHLVGRIHVHYGPVLSPEEIQALAQHEQDLVEEVRNRVRACLAVLRRHPNFAHLPPP